MDAVLENIANSDYTMDERLMPISKICWPNRQEYLVKNGDGDGVRVSTVGAHSGKDISVEITKEEAIASYGKDIYDKIGFHPKWCVKNECFLAIEITPEIHKWIKSNPKVMAEINHINQMSESDYIVRGKDGKWGIMSGTLVDKNQESAYTMTHPAKRQPPALVSSDVQSSLSIMKAQALMSSGRKIRPLREEVFNVLEEYFTSTRKNPFFAEVSKELEKSNPGLARQFEESLRTIAQSGATGTRIRPR